MTPNMGWEIIAKCSCKAKNTKKNFLNIHEAKYREGKSHEKLQNTLNNCKTPQNGQKAMVLTQNELKYKYKLNLNTKKKFKSMWILKI